MDSVGGPWTIVKETTSFAKKVYTEAVSTESYSYTLSAAQINAIKAVSAWAKQDWQCATNEVGAAYDLVGWDSVGFDTYATCWDPANVGPASGSGTETSFAKLPLRAWKPEDCGDANENCQHNVGDAMFSGFVFTRPDSFHCNAAQTLVVFF